MRLVSNLNIAKLEEGRAGLGKDFSIISAHNVNR